MVVSGHLTAEARAEFEQFGMRMFVQKPYKLHELGRGLRTLLETK
jgi:hypothetical protein